jgi:lysyl-tRNA synthetase class 2
MMATNEEWRPTASVGILVQRAQMINRIRAFFEARHVIEVETPILSHATVTNPHIMSIEAYFKKIGSTENEVCYLQTSPEYAMKRLLAAGMASIFQITKSFRQGEIGRLHNPEFSMLEWYRVGFDHHQLMDETSELLLALQFPSAERVSLAQVYQSYLGINPHSVTIPELRDCAAQHIQPLPRLPENKNSYLDLLFTHCIEPSLGLNAPVFVYDFPVSQASLAKIRQEDPPVASRFELYFKGMELANGFHELQDADEQRHRFERELEYRAHYNMPSVPIDQYLLNALRHGLPDCAGVALGVDRLVMLALGQETISQVLSFGFLNS